MTAGKSCRAAEPTRLLYGRPQARRRGDLELGRMHAVVAGAAAEVRLIRDLVRREILEQQPPAARRRLAIQHHAFELLFVAGAPRVVGAQLRLALRGIHLLAHQAGFDAAMLAADEVAVDAAILELEQEHASRRRPV